MKLLSLLTCSLIMLGCSHRESDDGGLLSDYASSDLPIATDVIPGTKPWRAEDLVMHEYSLESPDLVRVYYFTRFNSVMSAIGTPDDPDSTTHPVLHWKLDNRGCVLIPDDADGEPHTTLALVSIERDRAKVLNLETGDHETYGRRMTD